MSELGEQESTYGSPYQESEALLALLVNDEECAEQNLRDMLPNELDRLEAEAWRLSKMCRAERRARIRRNWEEKEQL